MATSSYPVAVMTAFGEIQLQQQQIQHLKDDDVLIKVDYCGICGTDLAIYTGIKNISFPYTPGHEYTGIIVDVGKNVSTFKNNDRVTINPNFVCYSCYYCQIQKYNLCEKADIRVVSNGGMSEFVSVDHRSVYKLPNSIDNLSGTMIEPLACGLHAMSNMTFPVKLVVIKGAGTMGLILLKLIRKLSLADHIIVTEPIERKRKIALQMGALIAIDINTLELENCVREINSVGADLVIECSGDPQALDGITELPRKGGEIVFLGRQPENLLISISPSLISRGEISVRGTSRLIPQNMDKAIEWLSQKELDLRDLIEVEYSLSSIKQAFEQASKRLSIKTVIKCKQ